MKNVQILRKSTTCKSSSTGTLKNIESPAIVVWMFEEKYIIMT
jgi:hypothetical protein